MIPSPVRWADFLGFGRSAGTAAVVDVGFSLAGADVAVDFFGFGCAGTAAASAFALDSALAGGALLAVALVVVALLAVALLAVALPGATGGLAITLAVAAGMVARLGGAASTPARLTTTRDVLLRDEATETFESAVFRRADAARAGAFLALPVGSAI